MLRSLVIIGARHICADYETRVETLGSGNGSQSRATAAGHFATLNGFERNSKHPQISHSPNGFAAPAKVWPMVLE